MLARGIAHTAEAHWPTAAGTLDALLPHALTTARSPRVESALLDLEPVFGDGCLALATLRDGVANVRVAAAERVAVAEIEKWLRECLPLAEATENDEIAVSFWSYGSYGATSISRTIAVPSWSAIRENYPARVKERLERLMEASFRPVQGGQLVLWYGAPGSGKTYALRALGWEWRAWCTLHYVVDPEVFFGERAAYMLEVILADEDEGDGKWRLLVLEDTGELLAADAREQTGQGLSRLLNLVDGIIGQGLRVLVLVTTNEPLRRLHPAVSRPGRCAARVEFEPFPADEAARWLAVCGITGGDAGAATLASLFARVEGYEPERPRTIGFGR